MSKNTTTRTADNLGSDLLWGVKSIGEAIGRDSRQTFHLLNAGYIPGARIGGKWVASRAKLRQHLEALFADAAVVRGAV
jgi:hypothetical protein